MYFKDFDSYSTIYWPNRIIPLDEIIPIGWLANGHDYPKGEVDEPTLLNLCKLIVTAHAAEMRSYKDVHYCDLCDPQPNSQPKISFEGQQKSLGSAEFWLPSPTSPGQFYAMPDLIYHYIVDHGYRPPDEFLEAVNCFPFNVQWNARDKRLNVWDTRKEFLEKQVRRLHVEETKRLNEPNEWLFSLQPDDHYQFYTGLSGENIQILAGWYDNRFVVITFDALGNLVRVIDRPMKEIGKDEEAELRMMFKEYGFILSPIQVKSFLLVDYAIGVNALPQDLEYFIRHRDEFPEKEKAEQEDELAQWLYFEKFEFLWQNDFWCDLDGYITDS